MRKLVVIISLLMALCAPALATNPLGFLPEDKQLHLAAGMAINGCLKGLGMEDRDRWVVLLWGSVAKEICDQRDGGVISFTDIAATLAGGLCVEIAEGIYLRFIYAE